MVRSNQLSYVNLDVARGQGAERIAHPRDAVIDASSPLSTTSNGTSVPTGVLSNVLEVTYTVNDACLLSVTCAAMTASSGTSDRSNPHKTCSPSRRRRRGPGRRT